MSAILAEFARVNDAAAATPKKLQKQAILAEYFRSLGESDLRLAVRYAAGRAFAATDERTLNVGGAIIWDVTLAMLGIDPHTWHDLIVRSGEVGEAIATVFPASGLQPISTADHRCGIFSDPHSNGTSSNPSAANLTLADLANSFDAMAATGAVECKRAILAELLCRCRTGREAAYLLKIISGDLRTGVQEGVLAAALAQAFTHPLERVQRGQLLVGDLEEVGVLAQRNVLESASFRLFHPLQFMLATPQESPEGAAATLHGRTFWAEDKLDGIRAQVHKSADRVAIYTRTMDRTEESFPDVVDAVAKIPGEFLLDGEIVPYRDGCVLPFSHIQKRLGRKKLTARMLAENPATFIAFDLLYLDGELLLDRPLQMRRDRLLALANSRQFEPMSPFNDGQQILTVLTATEVSTAEQISSAFDAARSRRNEGIVLKNPQSTYSPGRRGQAWLKLKTHLPTFDCVVTAAEYGHGKRRNVLSDYTFAVWSDDPASPNSKLVEVGKAYSGVTDDEIARLTELFLELTRQKIGRVHIVEPRIVLEIACDQIQKSDRHASGYALRFPRIKRIRWDKGPADADRLARIVEIYESTPNFARSPMHAAPPARGPTLFD